MALVTTLDNALFDFDKAKVQNITLEQLSRTQLEKDVYGNPLKGIYHFELVNNLVRMCNEIGYTVNIWDLFAAQNKEKQTPGVVLIPALEKQFGDRAVEAHLLRRVFANIRITDFDDGEKTTNLAVAFHQKGIQIGFGNAVVICHNQCMLCPDKYIATYGERGKGRRGQDEQISIPKMLDIVKSWLLDARHIVVEERERIERMKNIEVSADEIFLIIGMLTALRVKCDSRDSRIALNQTYPLNQAQITQFTEAMLLKYEEQRNISVWDMYNAATDLYKATSMDIPAIMPQNKALVEFLDNRYKLSL